MLDIIIPAYNAKETIKRTLFSIGIQKIDVKFNVYLVNDASLYDYSEYVNYFSKFFSIKEITLTKNVGPGESRNAGLRAGNGEYVIFIDSDDFFYSPYSLKKLYETIVRDNSDVVISNFIYERDNQRTVKVKNTVWLHGKIYRRSFLEKNNIMFNNTRTNEDNGFNQLIFMLSKNISYLDYITYIYAENSSSITRTNNRQYKLNGLEGFACNIMWTINQAMDRNCDIYDVENLALNALIAMYQYYLELYDSYDVSKLVLWSKDLYDFYITYQKMLSKDIIEDSIYYRKKCCEDDNIFFEEIISFDDFLGMVGDLDD